jgi:DNA-binding CsgD family transcriptional regulator
VSPPPQGNRLGAVTRGRQIGATLITSDLACGEALAYACRLRGVDVEVRGPALIGIDLRDDVVILVVEPLSEPVLASLRLAIEHSDHRVIAVGTTRQFLDGLRIDLSVASTARVDELVEAITGADTVKHRATAVVSQAAPVLTPRERDVLAELLAGRDAEAISERLGVSANTARTHVQNIITKLGVNSRSGAAAWALRAGISPAGEHVRGLP